MIATQSPYPAAGPMSMGLRVERFYYDGVRRIQEVVADPEGTLGMMLMSGNAAEQSSAQSAQQATQQQTEGGEADESTQAMSQGAQQNSATSNNGGQTPIYNTWLEREYIWGTGDGNAGLDELLAQFDHNRRPWFALQDAGGDPEWDGTLRKLPPGTKRM